MYELYCFSTSYTWPTNPILVGKIEEGVEKEVERYVFYFVFYFFLCCFYQLKDLQYDDLHFSKFLIIDYTTLFGD